MRRRRWLDKGANLLLFGPPGGGKSHLAPAIGLSLLEKGWRVLFTRTSDLVQKLQVARRELALEAAIALDRYHLLILDDLAYVTKDQAETSVLFELISARYERRSLLITANQPFGEWGKVFPDPAMTLAAVDRLVHHATIFEMNVDSYRRTDALDKHNGAGRPPNHATIKGSSRLVAPRQSTLKPKTLALSSPRDNHHPVATAEILILMSPPSHPDCRATNDRIAALAAPYVAWPGIPLTLAIEVVKMIELPRFISGASFCTVKSGPLAFRLNISS